MSTPTNTLSGNNSAGGFINADVLNASGKPVRRAVTNPEQLKAIATRLEQENTERAMKNARISSRYNAEQPYDQSSLVAQGLAWKANFSTRPLAGIIDRLAPRYVKAAQAPRYVTNASLPASIKEHRRKSEVFRRELTSLLRSHPKWKSLLTEVAQENALFGYTLACIPDDVSWMPRHFRQDEFFVPVGTGQLACEAQLIVMRENCLISEVFQRIDDREAAEAAGWDVEAVVKAINSAKPEAVTDDIQHAYRGYEDLKRDGGMYLGISGGKTVVRLYHILVAEITGRVSHYILAGDQRDLIFKRTDRFERMDDACTFFTFQQGNGRLHGSLGVGRIAYNMASALDRARCEVVDRFQLSGKLLLSTEAKDQTRFKMTVMGQAAIIGDNFKIQSQKLESGVDDYVKIDQILSGLLNEAAGNVTPDSANIKGERVTAAAVNLVAGREEELRDIRLERFLDAFLNLVAMIQRRLKDPVVAKLCPRARRFRDRCLKEMTESEFEELCESSPAETIDDLTDAERQRKVLALNELAGDPFADQVKVRRMKFSLLLGEDDTNELIPDQNDPNITAAAQRQQTLELLALRQGMQVPVLPTDRHDIHFQLCMADAEGAQSPQEALPILQHAIAHAQAAGNKEWEKMVRMKISALAKAATAPQPVPQDALAQPAALPPGSPAPAGA